MREKVRDKGRLEHILEAIQGIEEFHAQYTFEDIKNNKLMIEVDIPELKPWIEKYLSEMA